MNKDEMIENMAELIECEHTKCDEILDCTKCKYRLIDNCVSYMAGVALYNAGYCKVAEDEIVESMKTYERARQETAREILQEFKTRIKYMPKNNFTRLEIDWEIAILAQKYGIELE